MLLWLWHRLAALALIQPLAWELLYATGPALKKKKKKKKTSIPSQHIKVHEPFSLLSLSFVQENFS